MLPSKPRRDPSLADLSAAGPQALSETHAVDPAGYEVMYSRYSVTYRDGAREVVLAAEFDDEGRLVVHRAEHREPELTARLDRLLRFLQLTVVFD
jgi:hypothetical protein